MPINLNKQSRFQGGTRPWNIPEKKGRIDGAVGVNNKVKLTTHDSKDKINACLSCSLPDCDPDTADCKITRSRKRAGSARHYGPPPEDFVRWAHGPMTNKEWAEELGVSTRTITYWRTKYNLARD